MQRKSVAFNQELLMRIVTALLIVLVFVALLTTVLLWNFVSRSAMPDPNTDLPRTAIVFTGQFDRIHLGLDLLAGGRIDRLFITGVNPKAGLHVSRFADQFALTPEQANWIATGRIILAPDANSTMENARETACWLGRQPEIQSVVLITSQGHMARASLALQRAVAPVEVIRVVSDASGGNPGFPSQLPEFGKFVTTWVITLLPRALWPVEEPATCWAN